MIKRYDIAFDSIQQPHGDWVRYDDIKNLIPDNRVTNNQFINDIFNFIDQKNSEQLIFDYAKKHNWIKD